MHDGTQAIPKGFLPLVFNFIFISDWCDSVGVNEITCNWLYLYIA